MIPSSFFSPFPINIDVYFFFPRGRGRLGVCLFSLLFFFRGLAIFDGTKDIPRFFGRHLSLLLLV